VTRADDAGRRYCFSPRALTTAGAVTWTSTKPGRRRTFFWMAWSIAEALAIAKVKKVVFASSGCVYPNFLQSDTQKELYLTEELTKGPNDADNTYGWAKLDWRCS